MRQLILLSRNCLVNVTEIIGLRFLLENALWFRAHLIFVTISSSVLSISLICLQSFICLLEFSFYIHFSVKLVTDFLTLYVSDAAMEGKVQKTRDFFVDQTNKLYCKFFKYFCQLKWVKVFLERLPAWQTEESCLSFI